MAALTATQIGNREVLGDRTRLQFTATIANAAAADEWIATGMTKLLSAQVQTTGTTTSGINVVLNARGTGVAAGTNLGDLGIEGVAGCGVIVTVEGRF